jgi:hypothetical protein
VAINATLIRMEALRYVLVEGLLLVWHYRRAGNDVALCGRSGGVMPIDLAAASGYTLCGYCESLAASSAFSEAGFLAV